jgi:hypothetical protein
MGHPFAKKLKPRSHKGHEEKISINEFLRVLRDLYVQKRHEFVSNTACRFEGFAAGQRTSEATAAGRSIVPRRSKRRREA